VAMWLFRFWWHYYYGMFQLDLKKRAVKEGEIFKGEKTMFTDDYIKKQNTSLDFFKNAAKNLQELNKELKQDNDKWEEKDNEYLRKITKG